MAHQDWETVILKKPEIMIEKPNKPSIEKDPGEVIVLPKIDVELKKAIQQARMNQKLSQKELSSKMNIPLSTINGYENGTVIPNNAFIAKLEKVLNTKLPRIKKVDKN
jgi:ribosome-binding protein aMBF1 (putative translation factor)